MKNCKRCENCIKHRFNTEGYYLTTDRILILDNRTDSYRTRNEQAVHDFFGKKLRSIDVAILIDEKGNNKIIKNYFGLYNITLPCPLKNCSELREKKLKRILE